MRTFIAVEVPGSVRAQVGGYVDTLRPKFDNSVKWVHKDNLHFTVKFLGDVADDDLDAIRGCVGRTASDFSSFSLGIGGIGFFPSERNPRGFWLGADGGGERLLEIFQDLESCLEEEGFFRDAKPFSPHLTIGRVRRNRRVAVPERLDDFEYVSFTVDGLAIVKSTLTPKGPVYETLHESRFPVRSF